MWLFLINWGVKCVDVFVRWLVGWLVGGDGGDWLVAF